MKQVTSAGIIVYVMRQGEPLYLVLHYASGHWDFSKGHLEHGETNEDAAIRELKEETGLVADIKPNFQESFTYFIHDPHTDELCLKTVHFFVGSVDLQDVALSHEHQDYRWLSFEKASDQLTYDNAREVLCKVHEYVKALHEG